MNDDERIKTLNILKKKSLTEITAMMDRYNLWPHFILAMTEETIEEYEVNLKNSYCEYLSRRVRFNSR